jgi:hypothetical protein
MKNLADQGELFAEDHWRKTFQVVRKLPVSFSYRFEDDEGRSSEMQVLDWELGALFWNCYHKCSGDKLSALRKVKQKYYEDFINRDLHFFLGTTLSFHFIAPNPWVIIGVFTPPIQRQMTML